ncbi:MAG: hypothetical protein H7249_10085 [Chitinophagaceae bacterium]|nr:hypothetical protein [Oligoflexus sp.]
MLGQKRWLRIFLGSVAGLIGLALVSLLAVYFVLKSPAMQQEIIGSLKEPLAKQGVDLEVKSLAIDLLAGVHFEGLTVHIKREPLVVGTATIDELKLGYAIWPLLSKRLVVREAQLLGVKGDFTVNLPASEPQPPPDPEALTKVLDILRHLPITLDLPAFGMERVNLHLKLTQGAMAVDVRLNEMNLRAALALEKGTSALKLDAEIPLVIDFSQGESMTFTSRLRLEPHLSFESSLIDQDFAWHLKTANAQIALDEMHFAQNGFQRMVDIKSLAVAADIRLDYTGHIPKQAVQINDVLFPLVAKGKVDIKATPLSFVDAASKTQGNLSLSTGLDFEATLPPDFKRPEDVNWSLNNKLQLEAIQLWQAKQKLVSAPHVELVFEGKGEKGKGDVTIDLNAPKIDLKALSSALTLNMNTHAAIDLPGHGLDLTTRLNVNNKPTLTLKAKARDQNNTLDGTIALQLTSDPAWRSLHKSIGQLDQIGWPAAVLNDTFKVIHSEPLKHTKDWNKLTITNSLKIDVLQTNGADKALVAFRKVHIENEVSTLEKKAKGTLVIDVEQLKHRTLLKAVHVQQTLTFAVDFVNYLTAQLKGVTTLDSKNLLELSVLAKESPKHLKIVEKITAHVDPGLKAYVSGLPILDDLGVLTLETDDDVDLLLPAQRLSQVKTWDPAHIEAAVKLSETLTQNGHKTKYKLTKPLTVKTLAKLAKAQLTLTTHVAAPAIEAQDLATLQNLDTKLGLSVNNIESQDRVDFDLVTTIKNVKPLMASAASVQDVVQNVMVKLKAQVLQKDRFHVDALTATVDGALLAFNGKGDLALSSGRGGFTGLLKSTLPPGRTIAGLQGTGGFQVPFTLTLYDKKVLAIQSEPRFDKLSFTYGDIQVEGMDGRVSLAEELNIDEKGRVGFLYLNTQNPFTRVDFENIDPYLDTRLSLKINKVRFKHIIAGPLLTNFELRQNLVLLNDMKANLLNGSALGRMFIDLHPERLQLGFLGRFSNLQLELLKEPGRRRKIKDELSGRAATNFDIRKRLATGRIDVTTIGRNQLLSMLDVLDPQYKDTQMMAARRALQLSYPRLVSLSMEQGLMDLRIGLGGALSTDIAIRSIPLTAFINANAGEQLLTLEKFLQTGGQ